MEKINEHKIIKATEIILICEYKPVNPPVHHILQETFPDKKEQFLQRLQ